MLRFKKADGTPYEDWGTSSFSDICDIVKGQQKNKDTLTKSGKYPVINGGISPSGYDNEFNTDANTITISEGGNSCGFVNYLTTPFWSGGHCYTIMKIHDTINKMFLYQFLKKNESNIMALRVGSGLPNIQKSTLQKFQISLPCLEEQEKIADFFTALDEKITLIDAQLSQLNLYKKAQLQIIFSPENTENWGASSLGDHVTKLGDGIHGTPEYDADGEYFFINGNNLNQTNIVLDSNTKRVNKATYDKYKKDLNTNTVLISINGTLGNISFYNNEPIILGKSACYFNVSSTLNKFYIRYYLATDIFSDYVNITTTGSTIKNLSLKAMRELPIPLPSLEEQAKIADYLSALDDKITNTQESLEQIKSYKLAMLQKMMG